MNILIPKEYKIRHEILRVLNNALKNNAISDSNSPTVSEENIFKSLNKYDKDSIIEQLVYLKVNSDIKSIDNYWIETKGVKSFIDKTYLEFGKTQALNRGYDYGKNILVVIAVATFFLSVYQGCNNKTAINKIETKLDTLEKQVNSLENYHNFYLTNTHNSKKDQ